MDITIEAWVVLAVVIVVIALAIDRTRAYRVLPALVSRLRGRSSPNGRQHALGVDSAELPPLNTNRAEFAREKESRHGEGN